MTQSVLSVLDRSGIVICCGAGGVGKTTVSAAIGLATARDARRRVCVVTIDPARRLADALGISHENDGAVRVRTDVNSELYAVMFDPTRTFDELVRRYATDDEQAQRIMTNRLYRNIASNLSGTQEYLATEKLFELHESGEFDCIVIDTPPTKEALEFFHAPSQLTNLIDNRLFRSLIGSGSGYTRAFNVATQTVLRTVARAAGSEIVDDTISFFRAFSGMEDGLRSRAAKVNELLDAPTTSYVVVATPRDDALAETRLFVEKMNDADHTVHAVVANRLYPDFGEPIDPPGSDEPDTVAWGALVRNLNELAFLSDREKPLLEQLRKLTEPASIAYVPMLSSDVHDLEVLAHIARHLTEEELPFRRGPNSDRK